MRARVRVSVCSESMANLSGKMGWELRYLGEGIQKPPLVKDFKGTIIGDDDNNLIINVTL